MADSLKLSPEERLRRINTFLLDLDGTFYL